MNGADLSIVSLNSLYERLADLGVKVDRVLHALAQTYGWLTSPLLIVDDTSAHKYGIRMQGVSSVRVANVKGSVLGHNVVTLMVAMPPGNRYVFRGSGWRDSWRLRSIHERASRAYVVERNSPFRDKVMEIRSQT